VKLDDLESEVTNCRRCPRLVAWREEVALLKRAAFRDQEYWGRPVPGFGDPEARIVVLGLAPAAHGGNRTGRIFTGDRSGDWLFAALWRAGIANQPQSISREDGLTLSDCWITAAVRCAPPANKPTPAERDTCGGWLRAELDLLTRARVIVCLGAFAWDAALRQLGAAAPSQDVPATPPLLPAPPAASSTMTTAMSLAAAPEAALATGLTPARLAASAADFARAVWPGLVQAAAALGVPPAGLLAQAALETKWGTAAPGNNLFGIKASPGQPATWQPTHEMQAGVMVPTLAAFRSYASVQDSIADYVQEIRGHFPQVLGQGSVAGFAQALAAGGYATDRAYAAKLLNLAHSPLMAAALAAVAPLSNKETSK